MELRALTPEDTLALGMLMAEAFNAGRRHTPTEEDQWKEKVEESPGLTLGIFDGARLVAASTTHDLHLIWGERLAPLGGVAGVACTVQQRGQGHVARLLSESLLHMRDSGQYLSGLFPFSYAFYRRHGWEWVGEKRRYSVPTAEIRSSPEGLHVQTSIGAEALPIIKPVYAEFARRYRGMATREDPEPNWWESAVAPHDGRIAYVHIHTDPATGDADGYLVFRYPDEGEVAHLGDFFANSPAAYAGLLSILHYYGTQIEKIVFKAPLDDPLPLWVMHHDLETKVNPLLMGRIVDVARALEALSPPVDVSGALTLRIADDRCDWNNRTFRVTCESGSVTVAGTDANAGIALDVQALAQAYWGQPSLALLRNAGRLSVTDESEFDLLSQMLPPAVTYLQDGF